MISFKIGNQLIRKPNLMKQTYVFMLLTCMLVSCNSIKSLAVKEGNFPFIGTIGKEQGTVLKTEFIPIGHAVLEKPIAINIQTIPFTKSTFKEYMNVKELSGAKSSITYVDSIANKPSYTLLTIEDRIGLKESLNNEINKEVKSYLEKDADCKLVSSISVILNAALVQELTMADGLFLMTNSNGLLQIEVVKEKQRRTINLPKNELFDYSLMGVCWGESIYGKPVIETFNDNGRCPDGTEKDAKKLDELQSFLKL